MPVSIPETSSSQVSLTPGPVADPTHERVLDFTCRLFGGAASLSRELDPETSDECFVVTAAAAGSVDEIVAANNRWHRGLPEVAGEFANRYRLSLDPQ
jgi:hypothetical protein